MVHSSTGQAEHQGHLQEKQSHWSGVPQRLSRVIWATANLEGKKVRWWDDRDGAQEFKDPNGKREARPLLLLWPPPRMVSNTATATDQAH